MPNSTNVVVISGAFGQDPEWIGDDQSGCRFSLAVNEAFKKKDSDDWEERTNWIDCVAWGKIANPIMRHLEKGSRVVVDGRLKQDRWKNKEGENRSKVVVNVRNIEFMPKAGAGGSSGSSGADSSSSGSDEDDEVPF